jgi:uncharacterized pyridoxamine 5'-phosphate oxidase family protein
MIKSESNQLTDSHQEVAMNTAFEYMKANPVFHLATVNGNKARVRPFGFIMKRNNRLYLCTNRTKDVYKQLVEYPDIEISNMGNDGTTWLRITGKIEFDDSHEAKVQAFQESAKLHELYPKGADDETFITFYFTNAQSTLYSFSGEPKSIPLL